MEITIEKKHTEDIVRAISRISLKGIIHPALKLSRINITKREFSISTTNLSLAINVNFVINPDFEKEVFVDTGTLERVLSGMVTSDEIKLVFQENYLEVKTKISKAKIPYENGEDMPSIPVVNGENISLPVLNLKKALQVTIPGASNTDIKPELASVCINFKNNTLTTVATDAFQLIEYKEDVSVLKDVSFLLPAKEASDILKIIENIDGSIETFYTETLFQIKTNTTTIIAKLTQGLFPDYTAIIPKEEKGQIRFLKSELDLALKFLMQLRSETNHISFDVNEEGVMLKIKTINGGESEYKINGSLTGEIFKGVLLSNHLRNLATLTPSDGINLSYYGPGKPYVATGNKGNSFRYLMMPIQN